MRRRTTHTLGESEGLCILQNNMLCTKSPSVFHNVVLCTSALNTPSEAFYELTEYRIMLDYYRDEEADARPRIFGMTASPIDAKVDIQVAANELETMLDAKIATTEDMSLKDAVRKPEEHILSKSSPQANPDIHNVSSQSVGKIY